MLDDRDSIQARIDHLVDCFAISDPDDRDAIDLDLSALDRAFEKGSEDAVWRQYARQPHDRERDLHRRAA